jgi:hypothetical protein
MAHGYNTRRRALVRFALPGQRISSLRNNRFVDPNKKLTPISCGYSIYVEPITADPYFFLWSVISFSNCTSLCQEYTCNILLVSTIDKAK